MLEGRHAAPRTAEEFATFANFVFEVCNNATVGTTFRRQGPNSQHRPDVDRWTLGDLCEYQVNGSVGGRKESLPAWDGIERFQARDPFAKKPKIEPLEREQRFQRAHTVDVRGAEDDVDVGGAEDDGDRGAEEEESSEEGHGDSFQGPGDQVYEIDGDALAHVNDCGFDAQGNFYPLKGMKESLFDRLLNESIAQGTKHYVDTVNRENAELNATGKLEEDAWKLEWLDEYGYLVPEALEPGSGFLRENPHLIRDWVIDSPSPIKWRGNSLNDSQLACAGAVREWDLVCNSDPATWRSIGNESTVLTHTGMGSVIELVHSSSGALQFMPAFQDQIYLCLPDLQMGRSGGWFDEKLVEHADRCNDCFENKMRTSHAILGNWRAMTAGPRIVIWNVVEPEFEIHLLEDGFIALGTAGRAIQVRAEGTHPDRHKMYFSTTDALLAQISGYYNSSGGAEPLWEYVEGVDESGKTGWYKVLRHESAPDYRLFNWTSRTDFHKAKQPLEQSSKSGGTDELPYELDECLRKQQHDRERALALRGGMHPAPPRSHLQDPLPGYNKVMGIYLTPGKGSWGDTGRWVDPPIFRYPPRYRMRVQGVDNEREQVMHFERLEELRFQRQEQARMRLASCPPQNWRWQYHQTYSQFDLQGIPTHDLEGRQLDENTRRHLEDDYERHLSEYKWFSEEIAKDPHVMVRRDDLILELQHRVNTYDPFELTVDEETEDNSYLWNKPLGPLTVDSEELVEADGDERVDLVECEELPFDD